MVWPHETPEESRHSKTSCKSRSERMWPAGPHWHEQKTSATRRDAPKTWPHHGRTRRRRNRDTHKRTLKAEASALGPPGHIGTNRRQAPHAATPRRLGHTMAARDAGGIAI